MQRLLIVPLVLLLANCNRPASGPAAASTERPPVVAVIPASRMTLDNTVTLVAEFRPYREIEVMSKVSGFVKSIVVDLGDRVQTGQVLATLEIPEMADDLNRAQASLGRSTAESQRAREDVRRAESASQMAALNYDRLSKVAKTRPGLVAQQEIDNAQARALETAAQLAAARSALTAAEQSIVVSRADESRVRTMFAYTRVVAPFPGVVTRRYAEIGAMVQAGISSQVNVLPIIRLAQDNLLRLQLPIPESNVTRARVGFPVQVRVPSLNLSLAGKIARYSGQLQLSTRTMLAEVDIPNPGYQIKPGMFAEVVFSFESKQDALTIPLLALDGEGEARQALIVNADGIVEMRKVVTGIETAELAEILSGAKAGENFVIGSRAQLKPGMKVSPRVSTSFAKGRA